MLTIYVVMIVFFYYVLVLYIWDLLRCKMLVEIILEVILDWYFLTCFYLLLMFVFYFNTIEQLCEKFRCILDIFIGKVKY